MAREPTIFALFTTRADAEAAVNELAADGFGPDEVGMLTPDDTEEPPSARNQAIAIGGGLAAGGLAGVLLAGAAAGAITGVGLVLAAGTLVPIVVGGATGAAAGGTLGSLFGAAVTQDEGLYYQQE